MICDVVFVDPELPLMRLELLFVLLHLELVLFVELLVLFIKSSLGQVNFLVELNGFIGEVAALGPKLSDVVFCVTYPLLSLRLVQKAEEYVPYVLYGEGARLMKDWVLPVNVYVRLLKRRLLVHGVGTIGLAEVIV